MNPDYFPDKPEFYFRHEFEERLKRSPWYSLRAFARDLGMSPSSLSDFLRGKGGVSVERACTLSTKINLNPPHSEHFIDLVTSKYSRSEKVKAVASAKSRARINAKTAQLAIDKFRLISDWYHFAILELVELGAQFHSSTSLAKALKIKKVIAEDAVSRLEKLGLLICKPEAWQTTSSETTVGEQVPSLAIQEFHRQILKKANMALTEQIVLDREFQASILSICSDDVCDFKTDFRNSLDILIHKYHARPNKNTVYCLSGQLFRLAEKEKVKKENEK